jgi:hypothetical protein
MKLRCAVPHCTRRVRVFPDTIAAMCDQHWTLAPERMRRSYERYEGPDPTEATRRWLAVLRYVSQKVT